MGTIFHVKNGGFLDFQKERAIFLLAVIFLILLVGYFFYVYLKADNVSNTREIIRSGFNWDDQNTSQQTFLAHFLLLSVLAIPIVRWFLYAIKFTPFYLPKNVVRRLPQKEYGLMRIKRFIVYWVVSMILILIIMFYISII